MSLPSLSEKAVVVRTMFDRIAPTYDRMNRLLTLGADQRWRRRVVELSQVGLGSSTLDVACGTGDLIEHLMASGARVVGVDVSAGMLAVAERRGFVGRLVRADGLELPIASASIDALTCAFALRNVVSIPTLLAEARRVLRPGGRLVLLEVAEPRLALLRRLHGFYFGRIVPLVGGLLVDREAYAYLPASATWLPAPETLAAWIVEAGFEDVRREVLLFGAAQILSATGMARQP